MTYEYILPSKLVEKYGFTHLLCNGWSGIYADTFNKKFIDGQGYIQKDLTESEIEDITSNSECVEY